MVENMLYKVLDKLFGKKKEIFVLLMMISLVVLGLYHMYNLKTEVLSKEIHKTNVRISNIDSNLENFLDFYRYNEFILLSIEAKSDDKELSKHAVEMLSILKFHPDQLKK